MYQYILIFVSKIDNKLFINFVSSFHILHVNSFEQLWKLQVACKPNRTYLKALSIFVWMNRKKFLKIKNHFFLQTQKIVKLVRKFDFFCHLISLHIAFFYIGLKHYANLKCFHRRGQFYLWNLFVTR